MTKSVSKATAAALLAGFAVLIAHGPAHAQATGLGLKDCSDKYSAAKAAGKVGKKTFDEFKATECGPGAKPLPAAAAGAPAPGAEAVAKPAKSKVKSTTTAATPPAAAAPAAAAAAKPVTAAVFPAAISATHKDKKPSKARFATCLDQYKANKAANANGGMKWIQKGGGYFSQCTQKLKAAKV
jgi:hypothetical protein